MTHLFFSALALLFALAAQPAAAQPRFNFDTTPGNLPKTVVPLRYTLALDLNPARDTFSGQVDIAIEVRQPVGAVVLHARDLQAQSMRLLPPGGAARELQLTPGPIAQSWWLEPADAAVIEPGRYTLRISYTGQVNRSGNGLFRADDMLATQLESIDARIIVPGHGAPFTDVDGALSVRAPRGLQVLANMPPVSERADGDAVLHRFQPTPPMPSYLLAVSVGRYDALAGRAAGVPLRILTAPGKRTQAAYALRVTQQVLPFYNAYFGIPYALPKLDQLAVPSVRMGAMEDWGLISYIESALLFDPAKSSPRTLRNVFNTVAHEVAHQWFGDLVTAASWEEIWLNEAFATWMAEKAAARFNPEWHSALEHRGWLDETMAGDASGATRAIRSGPVSETAVFDVFDNITYAKGGAVLGMLEQWLGAEPFRRGLAAYMRERQFSNATAGDLWFHMGQAARRDVTAVAASWTDQPGLPLVEVAAECQAGRTRVTLAQRRLRDGTATPDTTPALWQVPVRLRRGASVTTLMLGAAQQTFDLPGCGAVPLVANAGGVGYYRVKYRTDLQNALAAVFTGLPAADQAMLFSDAFALAQAGELPLARWLALVDQLPQVRGPARASLFERASAGFQFLDTAMAGTPAQRQVRAAGRRLLAPELARLGWAERRSDSAQARKLRGVLIEQLAQFDDLPTIAQALQRFDADDAGTAPLPAAIRAPVLRAAGMHADRARFDRLMARLKSAGGEEDRWVYANALAGGRDLPRAQELLAAALHSVTTPNIATALPGMVAERSPFAEVAYAFTVEHWPALADLAGGSMFGRPWLLPGVAGSFSDAAQAARLLADQQRLAGADGAVPAARIAARIALNAAVRQREAAAFTAR